MDAYKKIVLNVLGRIKWMFLLVSQGKMLAKNNFFYKPNLNILYPFLVDMETNIRNGSQRNANQAHSQGNISHVNRNEETSKT